MTNIFEMFSPDFLFFNALMASLLMGLLCPLIGRHLVFGRTIMLGLAVPQISLAGIAFVFLGAGLGWEWCHGLESDFGRAAVGALIFTLPVLFLLALQLRRGTTLSEGWLAFMFLFATAAAHLMLSHHAVGENYIEDLFHGRLILINDAGLYALASSLGVITVIVFWFRRRFLLVLSDREFSDAIGLHLSAWHVFLALLNGLVIGISVAVVGPLVTFGFLILPVMSASLLARSLRAHAILCSVLGVLTGLIGFMVSYRYDLPLGATVVAIGCVLLMLARLLQPRWIARERAELAATRPDGY